MPARNISQYMLSDSATKERKESLLQRSGYLILAGSQFALWRVLLGPDAKTASAQTLKDKLLALRQEACLWAVILNRGGHFAAAIFSSSPDESSDNAANGHAPPLFQTLVHKTFHSYVVR